LIALLQRVSSSAVKVRGNEIARIGNGINILLGILKEDCEEEIEKLVSKIIRLRIFPDENGKMNHSIVEVKGEALVISQFTLAGNLKKGRRPSFDGAMPSLQAERLYRFFCDSLSKFIAVKRGRFGEMMEVDIVNDGPVTFIVDSREI